MKENCNDWKSIKKTIVPRRSEPYYQSAVENVCCIAASDEARGMAEEEVLASDVRTFIKRMCWKCNSVANLKMIQPTIFTDAISEVVFECAECLTVIKRTLDI